MLEDNDRVEWKLSEQIIGAAMAVLNELRPGLAEKLYENALIIELTSRGLKIDSSFHSLGKYKGHFIGKLIPDLIVQDRVIVDVKVVEGFNAAHIAQVLGYLAITQLELGLLLNFQNAKLEWKRLAHRQRAKRSMAPPLMSVLSAISALSAVIL